MIVSVKKKVLVLNPVSHQPSFFITKSGYSPNKQKIVILFECGTKIKTAGVINTALPFGNLFCNFIVGYGKLHEFSAINTCKDVLKTVFTFTYFLGEFSPTHVSNAGNSFVLKSLVMKFYDLNKVFTHTVIKNCVFPSLKK